MSTKRKDPIIVPARTPPQDVKDTAATIFIHGFGDDAETFEAITQHFINHEKLPYMRWVIPSAHFDRDYNASAWYKPSPLNIMPSAQPELDDPEDEAGLLESVHYIESLIDDFVKEGIPVERIVVGGFSQGCALSLLLHLVSAKYSGRLAGIYGLMGYMPVMDNIATLRQDAGLPAKLHSNTLVLLVRGGSDMLVPKRCFSTAAETLLNFGVKKERFVPIEYQGVGHVLSGELLRDLCAFLEKAVPRK